MDQTNDTNKNINDISNSYNKNSENFIGINIQKVYQDLQNFDSKCYEVGWNIGRAYINLYKVLYEKWASPNAYKTTKNMITQFEDAFDGYFTEYHHILSGAESAATALANANGQSFSRNYSLESGTRYTNSLADYSNMPPCEESKNGVSGMDTESVRIALEEFKRSSSRAINSFDDIPNGIAFYDNNNSLVDVYSRNVNTFKSIFEDIFNNIINEITAYLETEQDNILLAKQQAEEKMSA